MMRKPSAQPWLLVPEVARACRHVRLRDYDRIRSDCSLQRNGIASPGRTHRLRVDGGSAVPANHSIRALVEAHGATDLAGVKNRGDLAVGFLIQPETDVDAVHCGGEGVEIMIGNLGKRDGRLAIHKRYGGRGGKGVEPPGGV